MTGTAKRVSRRSLMEARERLSERDKATLKTIQACRYITSRQIMRLHFASLPYTSLSTRVRNTNRHLYRLQSYGLVDHLERRIGGVRAGSGANVWYLTAAGHKLLAMGEQAEECSLATPRKRHHEPTKRFLEHRLAVSEVYVRLHELTADPKCRPTMPSLVADNTITLADIKLEPDCWREYPNMLGGKQATLKPDLYAVTATKSGGNEYEDHWFLEVDLATESPATVVRKCQQYVHYYQSGTEQRRRGIFPRVVWIVPADKRKASIARHIADNYTDNEGRLFAVITLDQLGTLLQSGDLPAFGQGDDEPTVNLENPTKNRGENIPQNPCNQGQTELPLESQHERKR